MFSGKGLSGADLIGPLKRADADVTLVFLNQNSISYFKPVNDSWFAAHVRAQNSDPGTEDVQYQPDNPVTILGCIEQYRLCNPSSNRCTPAGGIHGTDAEGQKLGFNAFQNITAQRMIDAFQAAKSSQVVDSLGDASLLARDKVTESFSNGLPDTQWEAEAKGWFETSLSTIQASIVAFANAPSPLPPGIVFKLFEQSSGASDAAREQCSRQRIQNTGQFQSFSLLGIMLVIIIGVFILALSWGIEPCLEKWQRISSTSQIKEFSENTTFGLLRQKHELEDQLQMAQAALARSVTQAAQANPPTSPSQRTLRSQPAQGGSSGQIVQPASVHSIHSNSSQTQVHSSSSSTTTAAPAPSSPRASITIPQVPATTQPAPARPASTASPGAASSPRP